MSFQGTGGNLRTYEPHDAPYASRFYPHIAAFFHAHAGQSFAPHATGRDIADELSRNLRPSARLALLKEDE